MATIKFKHNGTWRNLDIPLNVISNGGGSGALEGLESVVITGTNTRASFPDLSPYIEDLGQIQFLYWNDLEEATGGTTEYYYTKEYIYCPSINNNVFGSTITVKKHNSTMQLFFDDESNKYILAGNTTAAKLKSIQYGTEKDLNFIGTIQIYYKPKEA